MTRNTQEFPVILSILLADAVRILTGPLSLLDAAPHVLNSTEMKAVCSRKESSYEIDAVLLVLAWIQRFRDYESADTKTLCRFDTSDRIAPPFAFLLMHLHWVHCHKTSQRESEEGKKDNEAKFHSNRNSNSDTKMGCGSSKSGLQHVDDSVHVMLAHDKKVQQRKGAPSLGYKERAQHPLLKPKAINTPGEPSNGTNGGGPVATEE